MTSSKALHEISLNVIANSTSLPTVEEHMKGVRQPPIGDKLIEKTKRKIDEIKQDGVENEDEELTYERYREIRFQIFPAGCPKWKEYSCQRIRTRLRKLFDSNTIKIGEWQKLVGCSSHSYQLFMKQRGTWKGEGSDAYAAALEYFHAIDAGVIADPMQKNRKKKRGEDEKEGEGEGRKAKKAKTSKEKEADQEGEEDETPDVTHGPGKTKTAQKKGEAGIPDVSLVQLDGQEENNVAIWETPAEIRKKINLLMKREGVTAAGFARVLQEQYCPPQKITAAQLKSFREKTKVDGGATSSIFYPLYVYFEKLRIMEQKKKSKFRLEMEEVWAKEGGFEVGKTEPTRRQYFQLPGERLRIDKYGKLQIHGEAILGRGFGRGPI